jgi:hypothetical protein
MICKAKLKGKVLVIELPLQEPRVSTSGKSILVATTRRPLNTGIDYKGSDLFVVANAYMTNPKYSNPHEGRRMKTK